MQVFCTPKSGQSASLSRRSFITIAAASTAATLPAVAPAEASGKTSRLPQPVEPDLEALRKICVANLRNVLALMHPEAKVTFWNCRSADNHDFSFVFNVDHPRGGGR